MMEVVGFEDPWSREPTWEPPDAKGYVAQLLATVESRLKTNTVAYWTEKFTEAGSPAGAMRLREEMPDDEQSWANGFLVRLDHELLGGVTVVAPPVRFSDSPLEVRAASPTLGAHSLAILMEAGLDAVTVEALVGRGVVGTS